jgi:hypothetical protein
MPMVTRSLPNRKMAGQIVEKGGRSLMDDRDEGNIFKGERIFYYFI